MQTQKVKRTDEFVNNQFKSCPVSIKYQERESRFYMDFHSHQGYEIYLFQEGRGCFLIEDYMYPLEGLDLILICPDESHKSSPVIGRPCMRSVVHFLPELLDRESRDTLLEIFHRGLESRHFRLREDQWGRLLYLLEQLQMSYAARSTDRLIALRVYASELLLELRRHLIGESFGHHDRVDRTSIHPKIEQAVKYISLHYASPVSLQELAGQLYISPYYLCHLFKKTLGTTISDFLLHTRTHHAKLLLRDTALPVSEIAGQVGFNSFSYFGKTFKSHTGYTPRDFRKTAAAGAD